MNCASAAEAWTCERSVASSAVTVRLGWPGGPGWTMRVASPAVRHAAVATMAPTMMKRRIPLSHDSRSDRAAAEHSPRPERLQPSGWLAFDQNVAAQSDRREAADESERCGPGDQHGRRCRHP